MSKHPWLRRTPEATAAARETFQEKGARMSDLDERTIEKLPAEGWKSPKEVADLEAKLALQRTALQQADSRFSDLQDEHQELEADLESALELLNEVILHPGLVPGRYWRERVGALVAVQLEKHGE